MKEDKYLIDGHKLLWHLDRVNQWLNNPVIPPIYIEVSPVSYCNQNCIFCGLDFAKENKVKLNTEKFLKAVREMGKEGVKSIMFAGEGEPLLHPDIELLIESTFKSGIDTALVTNGSEFNNINIEKVLKNLTWVRFSVDAGSSEVYAKVHGTFKSAFEKVINAVKECVKYKVKNRLNVTIGVQFLLINENKSDLNKALQIFTNIEIDYFTIKPFSCHPQMLQNISITYNQSLLEEVENNVNKFSDKLNIIFRKRAFIKSMGKQIEYNHCLALPYWGYINSKGDFYTCSVFLGDNRFFAGNLYIETIKEIFFGKKRKNSIMFAQNELDVQKECRINCRMARINEFLNHLQEKPEHINFI